MSAKTKQDPWDVIIVGAGPAGMFAANEMADTDLSILIIDMGREVKKRICPLGHDMGCILVASRPL